MSDIRLTDLPYFSEGTISDTDVFWIDVDNGDSTFTSYQITGANMKLLLPTLYTDNGSIVTARTVFVDPDSGSLIFNGDKTKLQLFPTYAELRYFDSGSPDNVRSVLASSSALNITSNKIAYTLSQVYTGSLTTSSDTPEIIDTYSPTDPSNFVVKAEVKGYCSSTNAFHYTRIEATYRLVTGVATIVGSADIYNPSAAGMSVSLVPNGTAIDLQVTGLSGQITFWKSIVTVF